MASEEQWRDLVVGHGDVDPRTLLAHPQNWRTHPPEQEKLVRAAIQEVGWIDEVSVSKRTNTILNGHLRVKMAAELGRKFVPVRWLDCDLATERLILATYDRAGALAAIDEHRLLTLMESVNSDNRVIEQAFAKTRATTRKALDAVTEREEKESRKTRDTEARARGELPPPLPPPPPKPLPPVTIKVGVVTAKVSGVIFAQWRKKLVEVAGSDIDSLATEVRRRLKL